MGCTVYLLYPIRRILAGVPFRWNFVLSLGLWVGYLGWTDYMGNFMNRQNYILKIEEPCGQEWTAMTQTDIGKFCSQCSKTVVDFTKLTDTEIIQFVEKTSDKLCGRLTPQQLNRLLEINHPTNNPRLYKILAGLLVIGTTGNSYAADRISSQIEIISSIDNKELAGRQLQTPKETIIDSLKNVVHGKIFDAHSKEPLPFASVLIKDTKTGVATDLHGKFRLVIPESLLTEEITLVVMYIGYENTEIIIKSKNLPITMELLIIQGEHALLGEVCIIKKKKWWQFWKKK